MAYIRVTHTEFEKTAQAVDEYITYIEQQMSMADSIVEALKQTSWIGQDSLFFTSQWKKVMEKKSTYDNMKTSLEAYAGLLRFAGIKYKKAQADAVNRSCLLNGR